MLGVIVKTQFEGIHCYPEAPEEVAFLRTPHRHIFHVEAEIETFHDDRELEFILVKREIDMIIIRNYSARAIGTTSCEQIATLIQKELKKQYPYRERIDKRDNLIHERKINVKVFEDNENGAFIKEF